MLTNCFRFAPRDSVPGLIAKICKYLKEHPGWSEEELEEQIKQFIGQNVVESFNGRTGVVALNDEDVNNLKIASAYFAEGNETIGDLNLKELYNRGVRFVFTNWNTLTSSYDLSFVLEYFGGSDSVVYYPMATGSGGGNVISVNGKTGIVELRLSDILDGSGAQVKLCTATEFTSTNLNTWNTYYEEGYRIVGVVNSDASAIDYLYLLKQDENNHLPIGLSIGSTDAYTPTNPPPYPVTSVNGNTGDVKTITTYDNGINYTTDTLPYIGVFKSGISYGVDINNKAHLNYSDVNKPPYPVTSVLGSVGDINEFKSFGLIFNEKRIVGNPFIEARRSDCEIRLFFLDGGFTIENTKTPGVYYTIYDSRNPPPYPVTSVNGETGEVSGLYSVRNPQQITSSISQDSGWVVKPNSGTFTRGLIVQQTQVTPDEAGWITIPWLNGVNHVYGVFSAVVNGGYAGTLSSITVNTGSNIRANLTWGSSPWPNQKPVNINLLLIGD